MRTKKAIKTFMSKKYGKYISFRRKQKDLDVIKKQISASNEPVPMLTKQQKKEIVDYWSEYGIQVPLEWHRLFYAKTGKIDPSFVPEPVFQRIIKPVFNNGTFSEVWGDKAYLDYYLRGVKTVRSVIRNVNGRFLNEDFKLISLNEAQIIINEYETLVIKPSTYTDTGKGVHLIFKPFDLEALDKQYKRNYVIQMPLRQNAEIAKLNPSSINTVRINSVLLGSEAHVMSAFIKVGQAGEFADNSGKDRFFIGISEDGRFNNYAIDHDLNKYNTIPSEYAFAEKEVANFTDICQTAITAHRCIPHFGFAFWDIALNEENEPVIVECNLRYPDTVIPQVAGRPFMGNYTEDILKFIKDKGLEKNKGK